MSIRAKLWRELDDTVELEIKFDEAAIFEMYDALQRALNCWPEAPKDLMALCDKFEIAKNEIEKRRKIIPVNPGFWDEDKHGRI